MFVLLKLTAFYSCSPAPAPLAPTPLAPLSASNGTPGQRTVRIEQANQE